MAVQGRSLVAVPCCSWPPAAARCAAASPTALPPPAPSPPPFSHTLPAGHPLRLHLQLREPHHRAAGLALRQVPVPPAARRRDQRARAPHLRGCGGGGGRGGRDVVAGPAGRFCRRAGRQRGVGPAALLAALLLTAALAASGSNPPTRSRGRGAGGGGAGGAEPGVGGRHAQGHHHAAGARGVCSGGQRGRRGRVWCSGGRGMAG